MIGNAKARNGICVCVLLLTAAALCGNPARAADPSTQPADAATTRPDASQDAALPIASAPPGAPHSGGNDLTTLSLEDLMNVEVTSVSKTKQRLGDSAAAVTVISHDDMQRSG